MSTSTWSFGRSVFFTAMALAAAVLVHQLVGCMSAPAQGRRGTLGVVSVAEAAVPATADELIRQMSLSAGLIFTGEVLVVRRPVGFAGSAEDAGEGVVEIDFRVEQAVRGVQRGSIYTLREWPGLWAGETERYRAGQHLLMLLRAPNAAGFGSPVHGAEGAIPLRGAGLAPGPYESSSSAAGWMVDVRWLQAQTSREQARTPAPPRWPMPVGVGGGGGGFHSQVAAEVSDAEAPLVVRALPGPWILQSNPVPPVESLSHVLGLCVPAVPPPVGPTEPKNGR